MDIRADNWATGGNNRLSSTRNFYDDRGETSNFSSVGYVLVRVRLL
jgi:hypothetical protein